jgi:hypothetical protein
MLRGIRWADGQLTQDFSLHLHRLSVLLPQPLLPSAQVSLSLAYDLALPPIPDPSEAAPQPFGNTASQSNLVDWYANVPPYRDGWCTTLVLGRVQVFDPGDFQVDFLATPPEVIAASRPRDRRDGHIRYQQVRPAPRPLIALRTRSSARRSTWTPLRWWFTVILSSI